MMVSIGMNMLTLTRETPHDSLLDFYIIIEVEHGTLILVTFQIQPFSHSMIMAERVEVRSRQLMRAQHLIFTGVLELISNRVRPFPSFWQLRGALLIMTLRVPEELPLTPGCLPHATLLCGHGFAPRDANEVLAQATELW